VFLLVPAYPGCPGKKAVKRLLFYPLWDVMIAGLPRCPVWCRLLTVSTDSFNSVSGPFLSEWAKCQPGITLNGVTVLLIANLIGDSESGSPVSYSSFLITICLSRLVSEIFACDRQMDNADHYYSWPPHCGRPANKICSIIVFLAII